MSLRIDREAPRALQTVTANGPASEGVLADRLPSCEPQRGASMRRMRGSDHLRAFIAETALRVEDLCHPVFIQEGLTASTEIESMPGVFSHPVEGAIAEMKACGDLGIRHFVLRPRPEPSFDVDRSIGFEARVIEKIANACPGVTKLIDGYFGMMRPSGYYGAVHDDGSVDHPATLAELVAHAVAQGRAGGDLAITLGRVDGEVRAVRAALDANGLRKVGILAYFINFASTLAHAMLGVNETSQRAHVQTLASKIGVGNIDEALRQALRDVEAGADYIGVKPATVFLDAIAKLKAASGMPIATYIVSKEYAMVKAAAQRGWVGERDTVLEYMLSLKRAGANKIVSYWARDAVAWLK